MATAIGIANAALAILGAQGISSFDEESPVARTMQAIYNMTREEVLRAHAWNCATKTDTLAPDSTAPANTYYSTQYTIPSDCLKILQVGEYGYESDYRIEGRKILCDEATSLLLKYAFLNDDETKWDSLLAMTMTYSLAEKLTYIVTGSPPVLQLISDKLKECRREARAVDGQDVPPETFGDFPLIQVR